MIFFIRKVLQSILGFEFYLRVISYIFLKTFRMGLFLPAHYQVRFLGNLVKEGDVCIDIGANLGYFSVPLSHYTGLNGKVYSVEPVEMFRNTLEGNLKAFALENVEVMPYALGGEEGKSVQMGTLNVNGVARHGMTQILEKDSAEVATQRLAQTYPAKMRSPISLFGKLEKIDFIKCDVEGYETQIIPHFIELIDKFKPVLEIEVDAAANKKAIINMLTPLGYKVCYLKNQKLEAFDIKQNPGEIELYFLPPSRS